MKTLKTTRYELNMNRPDLASGRVRLAFLTDLHNVENGPDNEALLGAIRKENPDLILCGGDMIVAKEGHPTTTAVNFLLTLSEEFPMYHALGNHELRLKQFPKQYGEVFEEYKKTLTEAGITFLENESELLAVKGIPMQITGYENPRFCFHRFRQPKLKVGMMKKVLGYPNPKTVNILLAHHPGYMKTYNEWGADLTLCGHNHGGIIRLGKHRGLISPNLRPFSKTCYGHHIFHERDLDGKTVKHEHHVIVSAGTGEHTFPLRINNPRELVIVDLGINL